MPQHFRDLVDDPPVGSHPVPPLRAVHRAEVAVRVGPFVPDAYVVQVAVMLASQEPQQFVMMDLRWSFLVVTSGNPSERSKRIW